MLDSTSILNATQEVILSAGAVKTPQIREWTVFCIRLSIVGYRLACLTYHYAILCFAFGTVMLSGIGDASQLSSLGIQALLDLPGVGQNLVVSFFSRVPFLLYSSYPSTASHRAGSSSFGIIMDRQLKRYA